MLGDCGLTLRVRLSISEKASKLLFLRDLKHELHNWYSMTVMEIRHIFMFKHVIHNWYFMILMEMCHYFRFTAFKFEFCCVVSTHFLSPEFAFLD